MAQEGRPNVEYRMAPELEALLDQWEQRSAAFSRIDGDFDMYRYDSVFSTETRAHGKFWHETPDKGRMDFIPISEAELKKCPKNEGGNPINPKKKATNGQPFEIKAQPHECWLCDGEFVRQIMTAPEKQYHEMVIPMQFRGESIRNSPLPFLFGLKKQEAKERYLLSFGNFHDKTLPGAKEPVIHIVALPLRGEDAWEWSRAEIILHRETFLPHSIRTLDPAGTSECVYVFTRVDGDARWVLKNPFKVSLGGFKKMQIEAPAMDQGIAPAAGSAPKSK